MGRIETLNLAISTAVPRARERYSLFSRWRGFGSPRSSAAGSNSLVKSSRIERAAENGGQVGCALVAPLAEQRLAERTEHADAEDQQEDSPDQQHEGLAEPESVRFVPRCAIAARNAR